jgi:hypothetical protein
LIKKKKKKKMTPLSPIELDRMYYAGIKIHTIHTYFAPSIPFRQLTGSNIPAFVSIRSL